MAHKNYMVTVKRSGNYPSKVLIAGDTSLPHFPGPIPGIIIIGITPSGRRTTGDYDLVLINTHRDIVNDLIRNRPLWLYGIYGDDKVLFQKCFD
jgi:hypothetical protein